MRRFSVRIGFGNVSLFDRASSRSIWENSGSVCFEGKTDIGHGCKLSIGPRGVLSFGPGTAITAETSIRCAKRISFGAGCLLSWDVLMMDQDFHPIADRSGVHLNPDRPICVGNHVWIGCRCLILKGTLIGDGCIVGAGSVVTGRFDTPAQVIAGDPARVIRTAVTWRQ
jgi:acetyltransferase-like isoleucine patch superfamily enzyme